LILDWLQNSEHVSESIRNIAIINVKNDKETYMIHKKKKFFTFYPQRNLRLSHNSLPSLSAKPSPNTLLGNPCKFYQPRFGGHFDIEEASIRPLI